MGVDAADWHGLERVMHRAPPGPRGGLSLLRSLRADPLCAVVSLVAQYGDVVGFRIGGRRVLLLRHPEDVQRVLQARQSRYSKRTLPISRLRSVLGDGLVTSEGASWRRQRRALQPAFREAAIHAMIPVVAETVSRDLAIWAEHASEGTSLDAAAEMRRLAFKIVGEAMLGQDLADIVDDARYAVERLQNQAIFRLYRPVSLPLWLPTPGNLAFRRSLRRLQRIVMRILEELRMRGGDAGILYPHLLETCGSGLTDRDRERQLRDELLTMLLAGHENTGNALAWMLGLLCAHRDMERTAFEEVDRQLRGRTPTPERLARMPFTRQIVRESLRLFPPSWLLVRRAEVEDSVRGYRIKKGSLVLVSPFLTHRHPDFWPDPERFDPGRFAPSAAPRHRYSYFPFGGGRRRCIGEKFALVEMQIVLCAVLERFTLQPEVPELASPRAMVSLAPDGGIWMRPQMR